MISVTHAMELATQWHDAGQLEQAEHLLRHILASQPGHAHALHLLGIIAYQVGKLSLGVQLIEQAIQNNPHIALFHSNLGEMQRKLKATQLSIQSGERAVALDPHSASALSNLGIAYYDAQQYAQAEVCHRRALVIDPVHSCSLNNLGSIYKAYEDPQQAIAFYQAAMAAAPDFCDPLNNLGALLLHQQAYKAASEYLYRALNMAPNFADVHCNLGLALIGLEQQAEAWKHLTQALQLKPNYPEAYYGLAKVLLHQHQYADAERYVRHALQLNSQAVEFYQLLADLYHEQDQQPKALQILDQALTLDPKASTLYLSKGNIWMEIGELSQAEEQFLNLVHHPNPDQRVMAHYCLVQLRKMTPEHASFQALLALANTTSEHLTPNKRLYLHFALGKCYDDMSEWHTAFIHFNQGARLKRQESTYHAAEESQFIQRIIQCMTQDRISSLRASANPSTAPIFIVGMPRAGSTLVEQILSSHSQVHGAGELPYWQNLLQKALQQHQVTLPYPENLSQFTPEICQAITTQYIAYLRRKSPTALRITDKMPHNFLSIGVIHALFPNAKIIHIQRNAIDTCLSCYTKLFTQGHLYSYDLAELGHYYQCYEHIMQHWRKVLPSNAWLDISYEHLTQNFESETRRLIAFCDLPWEDTCLSYYQTKRQVRTASFAQVRQPIYTTSVERWRRYESQLTPLLKALVQPAL